eukprot:4225890-Karenia_brevis.AAC.1
MVMIMILHACEAALCYTMRTKQPRWQPSCNHSISAAKRREHFHDAACLRKRTGKRPIGELRHCPNQNAHHRQLEQDQ